MEPLFTNDAVVLGMLIAVLAWIFYTSGKETKSWQTFYKYVPALLLCYFVPALLHYPLGFISPHWFTSNISELLLAKELSLSASELNSMSYEAIGRFLENNGVVEEEYSSYTKHSQLYFVASRYLLPASLILLCLNIDKRYY
jgi:uncharacterized membrane protein